MVSRTQTIRPLGEWGSRFVEADDGTRTHDTWLGKPVLYQLSYVRVGSIVAPA